MTTILVDSDNEQDLIKIRKVAAENGWLVSYSKSAIDTLAVNATKAKHLSDLLEEYTKKGGLKSFGEIPSEWQREQRKDKILPGR